MCVFHQSSPVSSPELISMRALVYKEKVKRIKDAAADIQDNSDSIGHRNSGCQGGRREDNL